MMSPPHMPYGLGYVVIDTPAPAAEQWKHFGTEVLDLMAAPPLAGATCAFRMDDRLARIIVIGDEERADDAGSDVRLGWEHRDRAHWETVRARLDDAGVKTTEIDQPDETRQVHEAFACVDPGGVTCEFFHGAAIEPVVEFASTHRTSFVTGEAGLGHVTLRIANYHETVDFYTELLGFHVRETLATGINAAFVACNSRQHSIGLVDRGHGDRSTPGHIMLETTSLDAVGRGLDRCVDHGSRISRTLGRHWNDGIVSFYVESPSGFEIEYGYGGRPMPLGPSPQVRQGGVGGSSLWGHRIIRPDGSLAPPIGTRTSTD